MDKDDLGAYSDSRGHEIFRRNISKFIQKRDEFLLPTDTDDIFMTDGAS